MSSLRKIDQGLTVMSGYPMKFGSTTMLFGGGGARHKHPNATSQTFTGTRGSSSSAQLRPGGVTHGLMVLCRQSGLFDEAPSRKIRIRSVPRVVKWTGLARSTIYRLV